MQSSLSASSRSGLTTSPVASLSGRPVTRPALSRPARQARLSRPGSKISPKATSGGEDFDSILTQLADKFEKSDNKGAIIGYGAAGVIAFFFSEWLIHLPLFNFLLGFPIQLVGLLSLPYLGVRYLAEGKDFQEDVKTAAGTVTKRLPGLEK